jgi:hypothetical protein
MPAVRRQVDREALRSVASPWVFMDAGGVLREGSAGSEATFNLSTPCEEIDVFLSHSWRDSGLLKYLALCWHFNAYLAVAAGIASSFLCFACCRVYRFAVPFFPIVPFMNLFTDLQDTARVAGFKFAFDTNKYPWADRGWRLMYAPICQVAAALVFMVVFLFGHRLRKPVTMFLDKVCIHQTNPVKKAAGIQAIDQFLVRSKTMLICYNDDYFERLWCCFELAARASSGSHIVLLPLWRAPVLLALILGIFTGHVAEYFCVMHVGADAAEYFIPVSLTFHLIPFVFLLEMTIRASRQKLKLVQTLKTFKLSNTKCFDPKDRTVVEKAISEWFSTGGDDASAIHRFEEDVRGGQSHRQVMASIGRQPGLMRLSDICIALYTVWIPTTLDFLLPGSCPPGTGMPGFLLTAVVLAYTCSLYGSSKLTEFLVPRFPRIPSGLLICFLFILMMVVMVMVQNVIFILQFIGCGPACIVF